MITHLDREVIKVIYPLMPKGVEHLLAVEKESEKGYVIYPLMPKGVEHLLPFLIEP